MAGIQVLIEENCRVDHLHRNLQRESLRLRAPRHAHTCTHPVPWHQNFPEVLGPTPPLSLDLSQSFPSQRPPPSLSHEATPSLPLSHQPPLPALVFFCPPKSVSNPVTKDQLLLNPVDISGLISLDSCFGYQSLSFP